MGYAPPPRPPSREEWDRRVAAGARTWRELDPEYFAHLDRQERTRSIGWVAIAAGILAMGAAFCAFR